MSDVTWSYSKLSCFRGCKLKYKLSYVDKWQSNQPGNELALKGSAVHSVLENMGIGSTIDSTNEAMSKAIEEFGVDTDKFPLLDYVNRLYEFYKKTIRPLEETEGVSVYHEYELKEKINDEQFIGYVDLLIEGPDWAKIVDFKTARKVAPLTYAHQLMLYAYLYGVKRGWTVEETASKVSLAVFFPLGELPKKTQDTVDNLLKEIDYTAEGLRGIVSKDAETIDEILTMDWDSVDASYGFSCAWCQFCGSLANESGFPGCRLSYAKGKRMVRGTEFVKKPAR